jgi:hypothetical protein
VEKRVDAPIVVDNLEGQAHFFPAIADVQQLKKNFLKYNCAKNSDGKSPISVQIPSKIVL